VHCAVQHAHKTTVSMIGVYMKLLHSPSPQHVGAALTWPFQFGGAHV